MLFAIASPELHKGGSFVPLLPVQRMFSILNEKGYVYNIFTTNLK